MTSFGRTTRLSRAVAVVLSLFLTVSAASQEDERASEPDVSSRSVFFDNDVIGPSNDDQNYTHGLVYEIAGTRVRDSLAMTPLNWIDEKLHVDKMHARNSGGRGATHAMQRGLSAFTPEALSDANPIIDDRPYASIAFVSVRRQSVNRDETAAFTSELSLGLLGTGAADWFQSWLHERMQDEPGGTPYTPRGWQYQISDGGELTARYSVKQQWLLRECTHFDVHVVASGDLGYYTAVGGGGAVRFGLIQSDWWQTSVSPIREASVLAFAGPRRGPGPRSCPSMDRNEDRHVELYGWAGYTARAWLYNALLQGQFRDSEVEFASGDVERLVGEYQAGVTFGFQFPKRKAWNLLTYVRVAGRTKEFEGEFGRDHKWGGIYYSWVRRVGAAD